MKNFTADNFLYWFIVLCICTLIGTCTYKGAMQDINEAAQKAVP